jgi:hypothetical protein
MKIMNKEVIIEIRPYLLKELAEIYGVHRQTMAMWLARIKDRLGEKVGYYYSITQVREIFRLLSLPSTVKVNDHFEDIWDAGRKS